jgi:hypothetical protein
MTTKTTPQTSPTWPIDLYVSMTLDYFEQPTPHCFGPTITIGPEGRQTEYHRMNGELYARLVMSLECMERESNDDERAQAYVDALTQFSPIYDWVNERVPKETLDMYVGRLREKMEMKRREKEERYREMGEI